MKTEHASVANKGVRCPGKKSLLVVLLFLGSGTPPDATPSQEIHQSNGIDFGGQQTLSRGTCFYWGGHAFSGDYFHGLTRKDSPDGPIFRKEGKVLKYYPERLQVVIRVAQHECDARGVPALSSLTISDDFAAALRFSAEWKAGTHAEPGKDLVLLGFQHKVRKFDLGGEQGLSDVLECSFNLDSHEIPLTSHLIVKVTDSEGTQLVRLSAFP
jgi:hypothetical protein